MSKQVIPIFYACDDAFVKFTVVSMHSIIKNASKDYQYKFYILHTGITEKMMEHVYGLRTDNVDVEFRDVTDYLRSISHKLPLRDYYSKTTYFRLFIAEMFPEYDKAIYIDSDTVVQGDISEMYLTDVGEAYLGACNEQVMVQVDVYGKYVERVVGVSRYNFFNAGVLLINCRRFRASHVLDKFTEYLGIYNFAVTQDEDYLNLICKDHVHWLDQRWNTEIFGEIPYPIEEAKVLHYIMTNKPWHYHDCRYGDIFWSYASETAVYEDIKAQLDAYTDELRERDRISGENLLALAISETEREDNFLNIMLGKCAPDRVAVLKKIKEYEKSGQFDRDVEDDPPTRTLMPDEIDYVKKSPIKRIKTRLAYKAARKFVYRLIDEKKLIIKEIRGIENFKNLTCGAVITCNHFNAYDSFAMQIAYEAAEQPNRTLYRVIREGNYTSFGGFYGRLMRNCNTLPLSSNPATMRKFTKATVDHLKNGSFVLFYPEQSMWWNYRKPKPLKEGAYYFAAKSKTPVLPCFITMKDSEIRDSDGFFVQEYTIHVGKPIFPDESLSLPERITAMQEENARVWQKIYETEYSMPLVY